MDNLGAVARRHLLFSMGKVLGLLGISAAILYALLPRMEGAYGKFPILFDSRTVVWFFMELHLMFAAFVLGVPIFAMIVEIVGAATKNEKYDNLAKEFTRLLALAFTATAVVGVAGLFFLAILYPKFISYMGKIFSPTYLPYALGIILDAFLLVFYYYAWDSMKGKLKWAHIAMGVGLNVVGTVIMLIANAWATFMMTPAGVTEAGALTAISAAIQNPLWWPINIHRIIANVAFGGAIASAYAAVRFLAARNDEERAHYDWMGYVGNFTAMWALIPLPFAGYWLGKEIYAFSAQMGTSMMGGAFSWLFIIQAVLIGCLFIGANYYMWLGLARIPGGQRYYKFVLVMEIILFVCMAVWMTPHTLVASLAEARKMGGAHHPLLGVFGVMSAKNTVVNLVILTTFVSFVLYRRANKNREGIHPSRASGGPLFVAALSVFPILFCGINGFVGNAAKAEKRLPVLEEQVASVEKSVLSSKKMFVEVTGDLKELSQKQADLEKLRRTPGIHHAAGYRVLTFIFLGFLLAALLDMFLLRGRIGGFLQWIILLAAAGIVIFYGVKGYFVEAEIRIEYSVYQVMAVLFAMLCVTALDLYLFVGAKSLGQVQWGKMPRRSQYVLIFLAVIFTFTIGLMGVVRSGLREAWHVYGIMRDTSERSYTPTMGYSIVVVSVVSLVFFALVSMIFWFGMRQKKNA